MTTQSGGDLLLSLDPAAQQATQKGGDAQEATDVTQGRVPQPEEDAKQAQAEPETEAADQEAAAKVASDEVQIYRKKYDKTHGAFLALAEELFKDLEAGKKTDEEVRAILDKYPDAAEILGKSKRLKNTTRALLDRDRARNADDLLDKKRKAQIAALDAAEETDDDDSPKGLKLDGRPLDSNVLAEMLQKALDKLESKKSAETQAREREKLATEFAASHEIRDDDFEELKDVAEALEQVKEGWTYQEALEAAAKALFGATKKSQGVNTAARGKTIDTTPNKQEDMGSGWVKVV